jgi:hypothetical protein
MDEIAEALVWSNASKESVTDFYEAAFSASFSRRKRKVDSAEILASRIADSISRIIDVYGNESDHEGIVIKYSPAEETGGFWTFDVRFTVQGEQRQFLAAARSLHEINLNLNVEIADFIRGMNVKRR